MTKPANGQVICVLGMHRSGTSCLTGSLQAAGVSLGKHHTWNKYNQKGNRENQDIVDFHDQLLHANRGSWNKPPRRLRASPADYERALAIVASFPTELRWGFKDPRALLALDIWKQTIPQLQFVGIFRHPLAVAASLNKRSDGGMPLPTALTLWYHYNLQLLGEYKRAPFPILCFDWEEEHFHLRLNQLLSELDLPLLTVEQRFYAPQLRNFDARETEALPWRVRRLYQKLQTLAG